MSKRILIQKMNQIHSFIKVNRGAVSSAHHLVTVVPGLETLTDAVLSSLRLFNGRIVGRFKT